MKIDKDLSLKTERFVLRAPRMSDIPHIFDAAQHDGFTDGMLWDPPKSEAELRQPLLNSLKSWETGEAYNFTIEDISTGEFIGRISIRHVEDDVYNVGFWTHPSHQSKGVMTEALKEVVRFGFKTLAAERIEACHALWNIGSEKVLKSNGFKFIRYIEHGYKKRGKWIDENLLAVNRADWLNNVTPKFGTRMPERSYSLRPGAYGLLTNNSDKLLLVEATTGHYFLPGGGQSDAETLQQTLEREFLEETGLIVTCGTKIGTATQIAHALSEKTGYEKICTFFLTESTNYTPLKTTDYKLHWVSELEAERMVYEDASRWAIAQARLHKQDI